MDESVKSYTMILSVFMALMLFIDVITFSVKSTTAKEVMYATVEYIEVNGYDAGEISAYAQSIFPNAKNTLTINVTPIDTLDGYRYKVDVSFKHIFAVINLSKNITYSATTRQVDY